MHWKKKTAQHFLSWAKVGGKQDKIVNNQMTIYDGQGGTTDRGQFTTTGNLHSGVMNTLGNKFFEPQLGSLYIQLLSYGTSCRLPELSLEAQSSAHQISPSGISSRIFQRKHGTNAHAFHDRSVLVPTQL